jgi:hypothetical protein
VVVSVLAWCAGAAVAVTVGVLALSVVGGDLTREARQSADGDIAATVGPTATPNGSAPGPSRPSPVVAPSAAGWPTARAGAATEVGTPGGERLVERTATSSGGSVTAVCAGGRARLVYWTPAQGYRADGVVPGPAELARLRFEGAGGEVAISVTCGAAGPVFAIHDEHDGGERDRVG